MKKVFAILLAFSISLFISTNSYAVELNNDFEVPDNMTMYNVALNSDGIVSVTDSNGNIISDYSEINVGIMPLSSISGYENSNVTKNSTSFLVWVDSSGIGGMGVTVKTSCSKSNSNKITFNLIGSDGSHPIKNQKISYNGTSSWSNRIHYSPAYFVASFTNISDGYTVNAQVWIYG